MNLLLDGESLTIDSCVAVVDAPNGTIGLTEGAWRNVRASREVVERWIVERRVIYGMTTGFGEFSNVFIPTDQVEELQENLIMSHSAGMGAPLPQRVVRAMLLLRINALAKGYSGVRDSTLQTLIDVFNARIIPFVPSQGSVGSSGDLAPLAHLALCCIGKGECLVGGSTESSDASLTREPSSDTLRRHGIKPVRLAAKEGLALINGTQMMTAYGVLTLHRAQRLVETCDVVGALSLDALRGTDNAFDPRLHATRPHEGQRVSAANLRSLLHESEIRASHRTDDTRVQDAYSLRCMPQVHGASRDAIAYAAKIITCEINSATDNPLIFADEDRHIEGGNFHGQPVALALDFLAIALAELASISERRTERLVNHALGGLPRFLTPNGGLNSGMMIAQYTAAALVSENKVLAHPASVDSIPTSANQEDHNSMGSISARKLWQVIENVESVLGIELLCAAQGIDLLRPLRSSPILEKVMNVVRAQIPFADRDRVLYHDMEAARRLVVNGSVLIRPAPSELR